MHTVKRSLDRPTLIEFNDWLNDQAEAHKPMKTTSGKVKYDENVSNTATKTKTTSKVFAATTSTNQVKSTPENMPKRCVACEEKHFLWRCPVFGKKTQREKEQNYLLTTCFASLFFGKTIRSDSAPSPANALKKVMKAPTTLFFTVANEFLKHRIEKIPKIRPVLERQR